MCLFQETGLLFDLPQNSGDGILVIFQGRPLLRRRQKQGVHTRHGLRQLGQVQGQARRAAFDLLGHDGPERDLFIGKNDTQRPWRAMGVCNALETGRLICQIIQGRQAELTLLWNAEQRAIARDGDMIVRQALDVHGHKLVKRNRLELCKSHETGMERP